MIADEIQAQIQREHYARTALDYDEMHVAAKDEHYFALSFMGAMIEEVFEISSVLDVGAE